MKNTECMIQSADLGKVDRLAAFVETFRLRASAVQAGQAVHGPCLLLAGPVDGQGHGGEERIVVRLHGGGEAPPDLRVAVAIEFDNASNPLMAAMPEEVSVPLRTAPALRCTAKAFLSEVQGNRCGRMAALNRLAEVMVLMALRQVIDAGTRQPGLFAALSHPQLHRALVGMHDHPSRAWTVDQLAQHAAMSRTQFMATFRRVVGTTPMAYLGSWRLTLACRQLKSGQPVKAVASRAGFGSAAAFSRAFSRAYGHAPVALKPLG